MSQFTVNARNAGLHRYIPKHNKAEDAPRSCEVQMRNVLILPAAAGALVLADGEAAEFEKAFFGDEGGFPQRFFGIDSIRIYSTFENRHQVKFEGQDAVRVRLVDKIEIRIEGGPQRLVWADFSLHIDDPELDLCDYLHEHMNRDVSIVLEQDGDLVDEMIAHRKGMSVKTTVPANGDLLAEQEARDKAQLSQAAKGLGGAESAEVPIKTKRKAPAKKAAGKRAAKKAA